MPRNLDHEQIKVLTALAEVVIGADVLTRVPNLIDEIDEFINDLSPSARDDLDRGLNYLGSDLFMGFLRLVTGVDVEFESFAELHTDGRRRFLDALEHSEDADMRALYVVLTGLVTTVYYSASSFAEELGERNAVDDEGVLDRHRSRRVNPTRTPGTDV